MSKLIAAAAVIKSIPSIIILEAEQVAAYIDRIIQLPDSASVKNRDISLNSAAAAAAMGGKISPESFVSGLASFLTLHAHGSIRLETVVLPPVARFTVDHAASLVKLGGGINKSELKAAVLSGMAAVSEKAAEIKRIKAAAPIGLLNIAKIDVDEKKAAELEAAELETALSTLENAAALNSGMDNKAAAELEKIIDKAESAAAELKAAELKAAAELEKAAELKAAELKAAELSIPQKAAEFCKLADYFGIKLTAKQLAALDKAAA